MASLKLALLFLIIDVSWVAQSHAVKGTQAFITNVFLLIQAFKMIRQDKLSQTTGYDSHFSWYNLTWMETCAKPTDQNIAGSCFKSRNLTPTLDRERCRFSTCSYSMSLHNIYILRPRRKKIAKRSAEYSELIIWQTAWATCLNNSYCYETFWSHATDISSAKFCMKCLMVVSDYEKTVIVLFLRNNSAVYKFGI